MWLSLPGQMPPHQHHSHSVQKHLRLYVSLLGGMEQDHVYPLFQIFLELTSGQRAPIEALAGAGLHWTTGNQAPQPLLLAEVGPLPWGVPLADSTDKMA